MKLTKRIIALAIVLCTLGAMMIPGVSAADENLVVNFNDDSVVLNATGGLDLKNNALAKGTLLTAYTEGSIKWKIHANNASRCMTQGTKLGGDNLGLLVGINTGESCDTALEFTAPGTGTYEFSVTQIGCEWSMNINVGVYVFKAPETDFASIGDLNAAVNAQEALLSLETYSAAQGERPTKTLTSDTKVELVGGEAYLLVLRTSRPNTANVGQTYLQGFSLIKQASSEPGETPEVTEPVDQVFDFTTGIPTGRYCNWNAADATVTTLANGFADGTYNFKLCQSASGSVISNSSMSNGNVQITAYAGSGFNMRNYKADNAYSYLPMEFRVAATGDYRLSASFHYNDGMTNMGAYIIDVTDAMFTSLDEMPKLDSEEVMAVATLAGTDVINEAPKILTNLSESVRLESGRRYVVVFFANSANASGTNRINGFTLHAVKDFATVDGVAYNTIASAIAATETATNKAITLIADAVEGDINLPAGVTLDLNGKTLTAAGVVVGDVIDSTNGDGCLVANKPAKVLLETETQIALYSEGGYYFYNYDFASKDYSEKDGKVSFWSQLTFEKAEAYAKVAAGAELTVGFAVSANDAEAKYFELSAEDVMAWAATEDLSVIGFYLTVGGFDKLEENCELSVVPYVNAINGTAIEYTYTVAQ